MIKQIKMKTIVRLHIDNKYLEINDKKFYELLESIKQNRFIKIRIKDYKIIKIIEIYHIQTNLPDNLYYGLGFLSMNLLSIVSRIFDIKLLKTTIILFFNKVIYNKTKEIEDPLTFINFIK